MSKCKTKKRCNSVTSFAKTLPVKQRKEAVRYLNHFISILSRYLITTGYAVKLPALMGTLRFMKYDVAEVNKRSKRKILNYKASKSVGKHVKHTNLATGGYWWKLVWAKSDKRSIISKPYYECSVNRPLARSSSYDISLARDLTVTDFFRKEGWLNYAKIPFNKTYLDSIE